MRSSLLGPALLTFLFFFASAHPQSAPTPVARDAQAIAVLQQSLAAMGAGNLSAVANIQEAASITTFESGAPVTSTATITTNNSGTTRTDFTDAAGTSSFVIDGIHAQVQTGGDAPINLPRAALGYAGVTHIPILSIASQGQGSTTILTYVGLETSGSASVHHVRLQAPLDPSLGLGVYDSPCDIYVDSQTLFITALSYPVHAPTDATKIAMVTATYSNYQPISGLMIPFTVTYSFAGNVTSTQVVQSVSTNVALPSTEFEFGGGQ